MSAPASARLEPGAQKVLLELLGMLARERASVSSVTDPEQAWKVHVDDSLSGLEVADLAGAARIADVGSGAGFPGLPLAVALPNAEIALVESVGRKCAFMRKAVKRAGIANAEVLELRSEELAAEPGREAFDAVTARAVGRLSTLAELASPLLRDGGVLVGWKGRRDEDEERELARAACGLAMVPERILAVGPYAGSRHRHLHVLRKSGETPAGLPRRPGMAKKRPRGS